MEHNGAAVAQQPRNVLAQGFHLAARDQPSLAADNRHPPNLSRLQR
jgi:hypothetical protein